MQNTHKNCTLCFTNVQHFKNFIFLMKRYSVFLEKVINSLICSNCKCDKKKKLISSFPYHSFLLVLSETVGVKGDIENFQSLLSLTIIHQKSKISHHYSNKSRANLINYSHFQLNYLNMYNHFQIFLPLLFWKSKYRIKYLT